MSSWISLPLKRMCPEDMSISPVIIFIVVDLPDPFGSRYPVTSPLRAQKLTLSTAGIPVYYLETLRSSSMIRLLSSRH